MHKLILPIRFLLKRRISYLAVVVTGLCVFVSFVVVTVLSGLTAEFKDYIHLCYGDCVVSTRSLVGFPYYEQFLRMLRVQQFVDGVSPIIRNYAQVELIDESGDSVPRRCSTVTLVGIDPVAHARATGFGNWLCLHNADVQRAFAPGYDPNLPGIVPGIAFLFDRNENARFGVTDQLPRVRFEASVFPLTPQGAPARAGLGEVSAKTFYCSDYTHTGHNSDWNVVCVPFEEAQKLCGMDAEPKRLSAIYVKFKPGVGLKNGCERVGRLWDQFAEVKAGAKYSGLLKNVRVQSWKTHNRTIVAMAETQEAFMIVIFGLMGIISVLVVYMVFYMVICHKSKDIGVLKSVGVSDRGVLALFLVFGLLVGICGSVLGAVGGWQFIGNIEQIENWLREYLDLGLWYGDSAGIESVPGKSSVRVLAVTILSAIAACLAGALIPSWQAARTEPVRTLQVTQL